MNNLVCIESQIFIWGVLSQSRPNQKHMIPRAKALIKHLSDNGIRMLLPVPVITEVLTPVPPHEHASVLAFLDKRFQVAPFDNLASYKCAELINKSLTDEELKKYREEYSIPKQKIKFDCMIAAIAITRKAHCIYSEDAGFKKFVGGEISVVQMPNLGSQTEMFT